MSTSAEFSLLRDVQRVLRLMEIAGRVSDEAKAIRAQVIARMAAIAPHLVGLVLLLMVMPALAQEHHHGDGHGALHGDDAEGMHIAGGF